MKRYKATSLSTKNIRIYAIRLRDFLGFKRSEPINVPKLYDFLSAKFQDSNFVFNYRVMPDSNPIFTDKQEAFTDLKTGTIYIKQSVFEEACNENYSRASFTLAHELGHYLIHYLQSDIILSLVKEDEKILPYNNPEWQADTFASEFLMPYEECKSMTVEGIKWTYNVSTKAAEVRYNKINDIKSN